MTPFWTRKKNMLRKKMFLLCKLIFCPCNNERPAKLCVISASNQTLEIIMLMEDFRIL